jgi:Flp pilus assembly protein TadB
MKLAGFLLLLAGWIIVVAAIVLFATPPRRASFAFAGIGVETLGLILLVRSHRARREEQE